MPWKYFNSGSYNHVYINQDRLTKKYFVFKVRQNESNSTDTPERSLRLWNLINAGLTEKAYITEQTVKTISKEWDPIRKRCIFTETNLKEVKRGWVSPFIEGEPATDMEMVGALIEIYKRTGRIVLDAVCGNFIKTPGPNSKIICIDIGMALQLETRIPPCPASMPFETSISDTSLQIWSHTKVSYTSLFQKSNAIYPQTIKTLKALLFMKNNTPEIKNVDFLKTNDILALQLAAAYDDEGEKINALSLLEELFPSQNKVDKAPPVKRNKGTPEQRAVSNQEPKRVFLHTQPAGVCFPSDTYYSDDNNEVDKAPLVKKSKGSPEQRAVSTQEPNRVFLHTKSPEVCVPLQMQPFSTQEPSEVSLGTNPPGMCIPLQKQPFSTQEPSGVSLGTNPPGMCIPLQKQPFSTQEPSGVSLGTNPPGMCIPLQTRVSKGGLFKVNRQAKAANEVSNAEAMVVEPCI